MSRTEFKPCPFCGAQPKVTVKSCGYTSGYFYEEYDIKCVDCRIGFSGKSCFVTKNGLPVVSIDGYQECLDRWNRRANDRI